MREVVLTLHDGKQVTSVPPGRERYVVAKKITTDNITQFFLKTISSKLINPNETSIYEMRKDDGVMIRVTEEVYVKYHNVINGVSRVSFRSLESLI